MDRDATQLVFHLPLLLAHNGSQALDRIVECVEGSPRSGLGAVLVSLRESGEQFINAREGVQRHDRKTATYDA